MIAVGIGTLLAESGHERISILKIDIERAERFVFQSNFEYWLPRVDNLLIELHDQECEDVFWKAIQDQPFTIGTAGELTICRRWSGLTKAKRCGA